MRPPTAAGPRAGTRVVGLTQKGAWAPLTLVAEGRLDCSVDHRGSWRDAAAAIDALMQRRIAGKAVLCVD